MTTSPTDESMRSPSLRLWPGVVAVVAQWLVWLGLPVVVAANVAGMISAMAALAGGLVVVVWWAFFSRAPRVERWGALLLMVVSVIAARSLLHESVATGGMGFIFYMYVVPVLSLALVAWAAATRRLAAGPRRLALVVTILVACGVWTLVRTEGVYGAGSQFAWRWSATPEERLLARSEGETAALPAAPAALESEAEWPGFRGPRRDGVVPGVRLETDWQQSPPVEVWRRPVGPGWSSFAVQGDLVYTQEQRGEEETVSCYDAATGELVWQHGDATRFWESNAGAGPRATPTLADGRVYTLGATGIVNALDALDGTARWSHDAAADTGAELPTWGFAGSPLVAGDVVVVAAAGDLAGYDRETGDLLWTGPEGGDGYSSPQAFTVAGIPQVVLQSGAGTLSVDPADGTLLWEHAWPGYPIVQPAQTADGDLLVSTSEREGLRRLAVGRTADGWTVEERWTSIRLKPYFNDFVVHEGHAYGFDGRILAAIDLATGDRVWKGGRYGQGQMILLPDQDLLLVISEQGELALVEAKPDGFRELATSPAFDSKTWNHPVLVDDLLLVRNDREMAAFRLAMADGR